MTSLNIVVRALCAVSALVLAGCQAIGAPGVPGAGKVTELGLVTAKGGQGPLLIQLEAARPPSGSDPTLLKIAMAIAHSDMLCNNYFTVVSATERTAMTSFAGLGTLFNFAGLIADGTGSKSLWHAYGLTAEGLAGNVKTGIFRNNEATILQAAMRKYRKQQYDALVAEITNGKFKGVPFELLLPEIERYHSTCTISSAITEVQNSVQPGQQNSGGNNNNGGAARPPGG